MSYYLHIPAIRELTASPPFGFAAFLRERRAELALADPRGYFLRQVAYPSRVEPSYLSKVERGLEPPGETTAIALAHDVNRAVRSKITVLLTPEEIAQAVTRPVDYESPAIAAGD